eukprot:1536536-Amphidinium_carterae.2
MTHSIYWASTPLKLRSVIADGRTRTITVLRPALKLLEFILPQTDSYASIDGYIQYSKHSTLNHLGGGYRVVEAQVVTEPESLGGGGGW